MDGAHTAAGMEALRVHRKGEAGWRTTSSAGGVDGPRKCKNVVAAETAA